MFPKRGAIALVTTALALVLLLSFKTPEATTAGNAFVGSGSAVAGTRATPSTGSGSSSNSSSSTTTPDPTANATPDPTATATPDPTVKAANATVTGSTVATQFGDVAVKITVANGKVTDVQAVQMPTHGRSGMISNYVEPILDGEALQAQSANIDLVSGATYTSDAYAQSLQSALDQAGIASVQLAG
jgi:uncharacterized protein with FMN-binding domain